MIVVSKYRAWDGREFFTTHDCAQYEKAKDMQKAIKEFEEQRREHDPHSFRYHFIPSGLAAFLAERFVVRSEYTDGSLSPQSNNNR